ncbi:MAG: nucleotidyltransferase family protein [Candidatus Sulfotelmatobacter sp.]
MRVKTMDGAKNSNKCLTLLSRLLLENDANNGSAFPTPLGGSNSEAIAQIISRFTSQDLGELWSLANSHHVIARAFPVLHRLMAARQSDRADWVEQALAKEQARIQLALSFLLPICEALQQVGDVIVIKSLDHWPDLGNDLDLYSNAESADIVAIMVERFRARPDERSWGDRLANKWNFIVPGLPELVEVHVSRLGQTGEQVAITNSLVTRSRTVEFGEKTFRVPAPEDRLIISTLQRMYRHFYLRLCDVVDTARLVNSAAVDYFYLKSLAESAGLWDGLATYLVTVSGYLKSYSGESLPLPPLVTYAARFGNELVRFKRKFLRIPIFPQAASLYASEWKRLLLNGELQSTLRLSLLPGLAAAAALELKLTGSDKGIW